MTPAAGLLADHRYNIELIGSGVPFVHVDEPVSLLQRCRALQRGRPAFEADKLQLIREHFGCRSIGQARAQPCVRLLKDQHVAA